MDDPISDGASAIEPLVVGMAEARAHLGNCSNDEVYKRIHSGELQSFLLGNRRKIVFASLKALIDKRLAANGDAFQPAANSPPKPAPGPRRKRPDRKRRGR